MAKPFSNESKPFDRSRPFHRVNSKNFDPSKPPPDGQGRPCGCRNEDDYEPTFLAAMIAGGLVDALSGAVEIDIPDELVDAANELLKDGTGEDFKKRLEDFKKEAKSWLAKTLEGFLFASALRNVPSWVPVERKGFDRATEGPEREIEGTLSRSFLSTPDMVVLPWTKSWQWNFHVRPHSGNGFEHVVGRANVLNRSEREAIASDEKRPSFDMDEARPLQTSPGKILHNALEVVWDVGGLTPAPGNFGKTGEFPAGIMFHESWPFWPMANDTLWALGRWVYDCTHLVRGKLPAGQDTDLHWTQIHPPRAIASYRLEGFRFPEQDKHVPAARFLFFSCRKGGYFDFPPASKDANDDPQFILDLPPAPRAGVPTWAIGAQPDFASNTVVIRPRLLTKVDPAPFGIGGIFARESFARGPEPKLEPIKSDEKLEVPDQLRVTVPLSQVADAQAYGFVLSAGWADPTGEQAARVKKVTVELRSLDELDKDGELRVRFGVNGRFRHAVLHDVDEDEPADVSGRVVLHLPEDARVEVCVSGIERHGYGQFLEEENDRGRQLRVGGIFQFGSDELEEKIKKGEKTVEIVVDGVKGKFGTEELKKLLEIAGETLKKRRDVTWDGDVDQPDHSVASAVARETTFLPFSLFNRKDVPLGLVDRAPFNFEVDREARAADGTPITLVYAGDVVGEVEKEMKERKLDFREVALRARRTSIGGDAHYWVFQPFHVDRKLDYRLRLRIRVEDQ